MVSFICDDCQSTLKKAKVGSHSWQCSSRSFSCIDCGVSFTPQTYNSHNTCVSEAEKYQGKLYKGKKHQPAERTQQQQHTAAGQKRAAEEERKEIPAEHTSDASQQQQRSKKQKSDGSSSVNNSQSESIADMLPQLLQAESSGVQWKQLSKRVRKRKPALEKRAAEEELWAALQQHQKQLTFNWTPQQ